MVGIKKLFAEHAPEVRAIREQRSTSLYRSNASSSTFGGSSLADFGYEFNENGELRNIKTGERFKFDVKPNDRSYNQKHYEALGDVITEEIYQMLESKCGLKRIQVPTDAKVDEATGFFFASSDALTNDKLLILIHGSGAVRAGQWARRLIINENLNSGTQIPYIERAKEKGYGVIVMNTNQNKMVDETGTDKYIRENEDSISHAFYVWDTFVSNAVAKHIAIVAHSAGGYVTVKLALEKTDLFADRVFAVAFTDSAHASTATHSKGWKHLVDVARNWITSNKPLDAQVPQYRDEIFRVSAGTTSHEVTSASSFESVFAYIGHKLDERTKISFEPSPKEETVVVGNQEVAGKTQVEQPVGVVVNGAAEENVNGADDEDKEEESRRTVEENATDSKKKKHDDDVVEAEDVEEVSKIKREKIEL